MSTDMPEDDALSPEEMQLLVAGVSEDQVIIPPPDNMTVQDGRFEEIL